MEDHKPIIVVITRPNITRHCIHHCSDGAEYKSDIGFTKDTPYIALNGELWCAFCNNLASLLCNICLWFLTFVRLHPITVYRTVFGGHSFGDEFFFTKINISILLHCDNYNHYWDVYVHWYSHWTPYLGFLTLGNYSSGIPYLHGYFCHWKLF